MRAILAHTEMVTRLSSLDSTDEAFDCYTGLLEGESCTSASQIGNSSAASSRPIQLAEVGRLMEGASDFNGIEGEYLMVCTPDNVPETEIECENSC